MKESITKFDLESAFKALDEIEIPKAGKVIANRPALNEIFSRKTKFDALMEEYYDISSTTGLEDAKEARDAEIAQAKLARIEKIVDLDADSAEDLLTSYVGKLIIQCPQCMTLFYKNEEDVVASEDDPSTVNVNEICQHCGNESGYSLIGKVGEAESADTNTPVTEKDPETDAGLEADGKDESGSAEGDSGEDLNFDDELESLDLDIEDDQAKKAESFNSAEGQPLNEELDDKELDDKLAAHNEYIEYLRAAIAQEEEKLSKATNEQVKVAIQRNIDAFKSDLENALPAAIKDSAIAEEDTSTEEVPVEEPADEAEKDSSGEDAVNEALTEALHEDNDVSDAEFELLMNSSEFKKPISDTAVRAMLAMEDDDKKEESFSSIFSDVEELNEDALEPMISDSLVEMYSNVAGFRLRECSCENNKLMIEGVIHFTSGNTRNTTYTFTEAFVDAGKVTMRGLNEKLGADKHFYIAGHTENKTFITESLKVTKD